MATVATVGVTHWQLRQPGSCSTFVDDIVVVCFVSLSMMFEGRVMAHHRTQGWALSQWEQKTPVGILYSCPFNISANVRPPFVIEETGFTGFCLTDTQKTHLRYLFQSCIKREAIAIVFFIWKYKEWCNGLWDDYLFTVQVKKTKTREDCMRCWKAYIKLFPFHPRCWNPFIHNSEINHNWPMIFLSVSVHLSKHLLVLRMIQLRGFYLVGFTLSTSASRLSGICCLHRSLLNDDAPLSWGLITCC